MARAKSTKAGSILPTEMMSSQGTRIMGILKRDYIVPPEVPNKAESPSRRVKNIAAIPSRINNDRADKLHVWGKGRRRSGC